MAIINGGFETGDLTGWDGAGTVQSEFKYEGTYSVSLYTQNISQTLSTPVAVALIEKLSFYILAPGARDATNDWFRINYTDESYTEIAIVEGEWDVWDEYDVTDQLEAGKTVESIEFNNGTANWYCADNVELEAGEEEGESFVGGVPIILLINGVERYYRSFNYEKSQSDDPDTFSIAMEFDDVYGVGYWDTVEFVKNGVVEFYGFIEEKSPQITESGLEYRVSGRCWKAVLWKKFTDRYVETREMNKDKDDSGFFGSVYPHELIMFILRCPTSVASPGKVRQKVGWGIPSDDWVATASRTIEGYEPVNAIARIPGLFWLCEADQLEGDWFKIDLGGLYQRVTAVLFECRTIPPWSSEILDRTARWFEIQVSGDNVNWTTVRSFDDYVGGGGYITGARDILASFPPHNYVRYIRIYITKNYTDGDNWAISQVYVWQADHPKYRLLDEEEVNCAH